VMLYIIVALIASQSDFSQIAQAPIYLISGFLIMLFHLAIMLLLAKLFKYDLFTLGIASLANIGGMASAPMLAAAYRRTLIPVGFIMALLGCFLGNYFGMLVAKILCTIKGKKSPIQLKGKMYADPRFTNSASSYTTAHAI